MYKLETCKKSLWTIMMLIKLVYKFCFYFVIRDSCFILLYVFYICAKFSIDNNLISWRLLKKGNKLQEYSKIKLILKYIQIFCT